MQNPQQEVIPANIESKKCYSCGKVFSKPIDLERHKNRKTPCLIREVAPENLHNPNRCIYCNKIFTQHKSLTRHLNKCKIKNGGMEILAEKVKYEQEIRILKEQHAIIERERADDKRKLDEMYEQMKNMQEKITKMEASPQVINNNTVNNTLNNVQIIFNSFDKPSIDDIKLTQDDLLADNLVKKMVEKIYFNPELPTNHTVYRPNIKDDRLMVHNNSWNIVVGNEVEDILITMQNRAYSAGSEKINKIYSTEEEYMKLYPAVRDAIYSFNRLGTHARCTNNDIMEIITSKRDITAKTLRDAKVIK